MVVIRVSNLFLLLFDGYNVPAGDHMVYDQGYPLINAWDVTHAQWCDAEGRRIFSRIRLFIEFASIVSLRILEDFEQVPVSKLFLGSWRFWKHARVMISLLELLFSFGQLGRLGVIEDEIWGMSCLHFCVVTLRFSKCRSSYSNWCV